MFISEMNLSLGQEYQHSYQYQKNTSPRTSRKVSARKWQSSAHAESQFQESSSSSMSIDPAVSSSMMIDCEHCHQQVVAHDLKKHVSHFHGHLMPFCCSLCGKGCLSSASLRFHMQAHAGRLFVCHICDSKFKLKHHLKAHLKRIHQLDQCRKCLATFQDVQEYNRHVGSCL